MFISDVLKRSWQLVTRYRTLWILGMLLAITSGFSMTTGLPNTWEDTQYVNLQSWQLSAADREWIQENLGIVLSGDFELTIPQFVTPELESLVAAASGLLLVLVAGLLLVFFILLVVRYIAETGLIRSVHQIEERDEPVGVWVGFKLGVSRPAWRLFAIDLVVFIAVALLLTMLVVPPAVFIPFMAGIGEAALAFGIIAVLGYSVPVFLLVIFLLMAVVGFTRICHRAAVLEGLGVFPAIGRGFRLLSAHMKELGVLWLVMLGIDLIWPFVLFPVLLVAVLGSLLLSSMVVVPGMLALVSVNAGGWAFITGGVLSILLFLSLMAIPLIFAGGMKEAFTSSAWTVAYRELAPVKPEAEKPEPAGEEALAPASS